MIKYKICLKIKNRKFDILKNFINLKHSTEIKNSVNIFTSTLSDRFKILNNYTAFISLLYHRNVKNILK